MQNNYKDSWFIESEMFRDINSSLDSNSSQQKDVSKEKYYSSPIAEINSKKELMRALFELKSRVCRDIDDTSLHLVNGIISYMTDENRVITSKDKLNPSINVRQRSLEGNDNLINVVANISASSSIVLDSGACEIEGFVEEAKKRAVYNLLEHLQSEN